MSPAQKKEPRPNSDPITPWNPSRTATARVKDPLPAPTECRHCGSPVDLLSHTEVYGREYGPWPWMFRCCGCSAQVGLHPFTGIPLGTLATQPEREARQRAKDAFNCVWQHKHMSRTEAYAWLAGALGIPVDRCHIGWFGVEECDAVRAEVADFMARLRKMA